MNGWQAVRTIIAFELKRDWLGVLVTVVFALYFGVLYSGLTEPPEDGSSVSNMLNGMRDWIYLFALPLFGCVMNRTCFAYWRNDPFTRRFAHWRTMPIPLRAIASARHVQSILLLHLAGGLFIAVPCLLNPSWMTVGDGASWIPGGIVWIAYALIVQTGYIYMELGFSGRTFVKLYLGFVAITGVLSTLLAWQGVSLYLEVLRLADTQPVLAPLAAITAAIAAIKLGHEMTVRRMQNRSYTF
ncbi:hypothetical protein COLU111180_02755 [Cohnella lubricantis]|uniref:ABC transporter permease n=1 Tax=Cohnella lubricantis TaxID=2163172 RepID=A0A841T9N0_9BACL|nr:hypothetical protein [Cohnella lubricantis]MBB6675747.1 hypothetical protein [Cohnella lubricantis]MBP2118891.1 hypothetical protein [Cohnella lubricantis]